jgi:hypothetical protein
MQEKVKRNSIRKLEFALSGGLLEEHQIFNRIKMSRGGVESREQKAARHFSYKNVEA